MKIKPWVRVTPFTVGPHSHDVGGTPLRDQAWIADTRSVLEASREMALSAEICARSTRPACSEHLDMVFYSLGSALGAAATTVISTAHGWAGSSLLGAGFAACALAVWAIVGSQGSWPFLNDLDPSIRHKMRFS